jgi:hypothetical protein
VPRAGAESRDASACSEGPSSGERCRHWAASFGWRWDTTSSDRQEGEPSDQQECARTANFSERRTYELRRITLPRTWVNKQGSDYSSSCPYCLRAALLAFGSGSGRSHKET